MYSCIKMAIPVLLLLLSVLTSCTNESERSNEFHTLANIKSNYIDRIQYTPDVPSDNWQSAKQTLELKTGDCEDFAILYAAILMRVSQDYKEKIFFGNYKSIFSEQQHLVLIVDGYYIVDNYGISKMTTFYRGEFELKNIFPIVNSRTPLTYYDLPKL